MKTKQSKVINKLRTKNAWSCLHYYDTGERISRWRINVIDSEHNNKQPTDRLHGVNAGNILANGCVSTDLEEKSLDLEKGEVVEMLPDLEEWERWKKKGKHPDRGF